MPMLARLVVTLGGGGGSSTRVFTIFSCHCSRCAQQRLLWAKKEPHDAGPWPKRLSTAFRSLSDPPPPLVPTYLEPGTVISGTWRDGHKKGTQAQRLLADCVSTPPTRLSTMRLYRYAVVRTVRIHSPFTSDDLENAKPKLPPHPQSAGGGGETNVPGMSNMVPSKRLEDTKSPQSILRLSMSGQVTQMTPPGDERGGDLGRTKKQNKKTRVTTIRE